MVFAEISPTGSGSHVEEEGMKERKKEEGLFGREGREISFHLRLSRRIRRIYLLDMRSTTLHNAKLSRGIRGCVLERTRVHLQFALVWIPSYLPHPIIFLRTYENCAPLCTPGDIRSPIPYSNVRGWAGSLGELGTRRERR